VVKVRGNAGDRRSPGPQKVPRSVPGPHTVEYSGERFLERIFYAEAKYIEMKGCFIMQIGVCCIR